jgi:hypothetical protein
MFRPNPEALGTGAAVRDFLDEGPGTVSLDELDQLDAEARRALLLIWNLGHKRGAKYSLMIGGEKKLINLCAPMIMAGVGKFLGATQMSRAFKLEWEPYTEETRPERKYDDEDVSDLNAVYSFLRNWAAKVKLNLGPPMPPGVLRRFEDNVRPLLAIADSCGPEWGRRAREAVIFLLEKEKAEHPKITLIRHGLVIFAALEVDEIKSTRFNQEVKRLDLPDANWTRYRGPSGMEYVHSLTMAEQATLLEMVGIKSTRVRPPGEKQCRGLKLAQFQEAQRKYGVVIPDDVEPGRARLRLITPFD